MSEIQCGPSSFVYCGRVSGFASLDGDVCATCAFPILIVRYGSAYSFASE